MSRRGADRADPAGPGRALRRAGIHRRRIPGDRALGLLLAAESASALAATEKAVTGLPWRAGIRLDLLADMPRPRPGERPARLAQPARQINDAFGFPVNPDSAVDLRAAFRRAGFDIDSTRPLGDQGTAAPGRRSRDDLQGALAGAHRERLELAR